MRERTPGGKDRYKCREHDRALPPAKSVGESGFEEGDACAQTPGDVTPTREMVVTSTPVPGPLSHASGVRIVCEGRGERPTEAPGQSPRHYCSWVSRETHYCSWVSRETHYCSWVSRETHYCSWVSRETHYCLWAKANPFRSRQTHSVGEAADSRFAGPYRSAFPPEGHGP
jgi:hypothetical protein